MSEQKNYHLECTGVALDTADKHTQDQDITLFGSCFCPFVQRVWVALEYLHIPYKPFYLAAANLTDYTDEVDPYKKPADLLQVSPKGLVPGLKLHKYTPPRGLNESTVILEYLEDLAASTTRRSLLPTDPYARALVRLQCDHISRSLVPAFYRFLQAQEENAQIECGKEFRAALETLVTLFERAEEEIRALGAGLGSWLEGGDLNLSDVMVAPWIFRATNVLKHYRGFELPTGHKFEAWIIRLFGHPAFKATCSTEELYLDSYERYAQNRPNTSQVANAINSGKPLP
ncbi:glutathione S-transferase [Mycena haematopus]|nr:glutathione S-transferase [Mycena haematopus]